jgi:S1-C subfamily serine protease
MQGTATSTQPVEYSPVPPVQPPVIPPDNRPAGGPPPRRAGRGITLLALVMLLIFGTGIFAGVEFATSHTSVTPQSTAVATSPSTTSTPAASSSSSSTQDSEAQRETVIEQTRPAVVEVSVTLANGEGIGSGVVIDKNGDIVTNNHVVDGAQTIKVTLIDGSTLSAQLVGTDPADDLAVIKINPPANLTVATLGDSSKLVVGQEVLAIGNPLGITQTVTNGIVSALNRTMSEDGTSTQAGATIPNMIQTDAPINPGNSGGALVDLQGQVIGMPTLGATNTESNTQAAGIGFAIPANRISFIAQQLIKDGKVTHTGRAMLGVSIGQSQQTASDQGAYVAQVTAGGPADKAGMQVGDVIVKVDSQTIDSSDALGEVLATKQPGDKVSVVVERSGQQVTLNVTLGELPAGS